MLGFLSGLIVALLLIAIETLLATKKRIQLIESVTKTVQQRFKQQGEILKGKTDIERAIETRLEKGEASLDEIL